MFLETEPGFLINWLHIRKCAPSALRNSLLLDSTERKLGLLDLPGVPGGHSAHAHTGR